MRIGMTHAMASTVAGKRRRLTIAPWCASGTCWGTNTGISGFSTIPGPFENAAGTAPLAAETPARGVNMSNARHRSMIDLKGLAATKVQKYYTISDEGERARNRRAVTVHGAAQAVIGRVLGMVCGKTTIHPDLDERVADHSFSVDRWATLHAWEGKGRFRDYRTVVVGRILAALAGRAAEELILGSARDAIDSDDYWQVGLMLDDIGWPQASADNEADRQRYLNRLVTRAKALVSRHRHRIERVTETLLLKGTLQAEEIDRLLLDGHRPESHLSERMFSGGSVMQDA